MVMTLALKVLERDRKIEPWETRFVPAGFNAVITPEEEELLRAMEELSLKGELKTISMEEMQGRFSLSKAKLNKLLTLLVERRKVVQGKDGFLLHSKWFDDIISRIKESGKKELSVYEFKRMTGLTRKYAIPLLELLDQLGVTRRKGSSREILK
jgi:selenocysteine-specific elongation factor